MPLDVVEFQKGYATLLHGLAGLLPRDPDFPTEYNDAITGKLQPPNHQAAVVVDQDSQRVVREMLWGFPPFKAGAGLGTNFRTLNNRLWRDWLDREHRCVVPASAFAEPDKNTPKGSKEWRWFERADGQSFFFAGIWRPWTGAKAAHS